MINVYAGDLVLVMKTGSLRNYKIDDKLESNPYEIVDQQVNDKEKLMPFFKVVEIVQTGDP